MTSWLVRSRVAATDSFLLSVIVYKGALCAVFHPSSLWMFVYVNIFLDVIDERERKREREI